MNEIVGAPPSTSVAAPVPPPGDRIPVLDALRGIAILLVMLVHFTPDYRMPNRLLEWIKKAALAGWTGVDLFFVLSGFLITGILLRTKASPHYFRDFYGRRALRILPLYLGTLALLFLVAPRVWPALRADPGFARMETMQGWLWVHCANVAVWLHGFDVLNSDYFNVSHLWSLAIEEHFYLVWPAIVWWSTERRLPWVCGALIAIALGFRLGNLHATGGAFHTGDPFFLTNFRMDSLAFGALLALFVRRWAIQSMRWPALAVMLLSSSILAVHFFTVKGLWLGEAWIRGFGFTLISLTYAGAMIFLLSLPAQSRLRKIVDLPFLRFFGKYSYGLYVIHFLIAPLLERLLPFEQVRLACGELATVLISVGVKIPICVGLAWLSWTLLEQPCLRLKRYFPYAEK